jgi:hypothetical protein
MTKQDVEKMVDRKIKESLVEGHSIYSIVEDLRTRVKNMMKVLEQEGVDFEELCQRDFSTLSVDDFKIGNIKSTRARYTVFYVKHSLKRIDTMLWVAKNAKNFPFQPKSKVFGLYLLKEKLSQENAFPF